MKCKTLKRYREKKRRWIKKAFKNWNKIKIKKPIKVIKPVEKPEPKIGWFKRIIIYLKNKLKNIIKWARKRNKK